MEALQSVAQDMRFKCSFSDDQSQYEFESVDEVLKHKGPIIKELNAEFSQNGSGERIYIHFARTLVSMVAYGKSNVLKALWLEFDSILSSRRTRIGMIHLPAFWGGIFTGALAAVVVLGAFMKTFNIDGLALLMLTALAFLYSMYNWANHPVIFLDHRHKLSTFWRRNGDKMIILIFGTVIGLLAKMLYDYLLK